MSDSNHLSARSKVEPRWTSSKKAGVGTAIEAESPLWFTIGHGILNELYYPTIDQANTRDVGFLVATKDKFTEVKRDCVHHVEGIAEGVPAYRIVNTCEAGRFRLTEEIVTDPRRPTLLMRLKFECLRGKLDEYRLFVLAAPHIGNQGEDNDAWIGQFKGTELLCAGRGTTALASAVLRGGCRVVADTSE